MKPESMNDEWRQRVQDLATAAPPEKLDCLSFDYEGMHVHVFGVLHDISGGLNAEYRELLVRTAESAAGVAFAEKALFALLRMTREAVSLCDWAVITPWDGFGMGLRLTLLPTSWRVATADLLAEALQRHDSFPRTRNAADLAGSPCFHLLDAWERRRLIGFPSPADGLRHDLTLLAQPWRELWPRSPRSVSAKWNRILRLVQRHGHIPCRSLHMLTFAVEFARHKGWREISLFVGETHNTDMAWLAENIAAFRMGLEDRLDRRFDQVVARARRRASEAASGNWRLHLWQAVYFASLLAGAMCGLAIILVIGLWLLTTWIKMSAR